jgi:hypothetical protein
VYRTGWFVLCETVVHDSGTNHLTMVNALAELRAGTFPCLYTKFAFAAVLHLEGEPAGDLCLRMVRVCGKGEEIVISVPENTAPARAQFYFNFPSGLRLFEAGTITFRIEAREGAGEWYPVGQQCIEVGKTPG